MCENQLLIKTQKNIERFSLLKGVCVVGVSGGADSMALLDVLNRLNEGKIVCAHVEHGIRGEESIRDAELVKKFCLLHDIPFYMKSIRALDLAREQGMTVEQVARSERYGFFQAIRILTKADRIAVAHHLDDQAETLLFNLVRGAGSKGLSAMDWTRADGVIRPFLNISKEEILDYCKENNIEFATDSTNDDVNYSRNLLRHNVLPQLKKLNPSVTTAICRTAQLIREDDACLEKMAYEAMAGKVEITDNQLRIKRDIVENPQPIASRIIRQSLAQWGVDRDIEQNHIEAIIELIKSSPVGSSLDLPHFLKAVLSYDHIVFLYERENEEIEYAFDQGVYQTALGEVEIELKPVDRNRAVGIERLDRSKLPDGCVLRTRKSGDVITPLGMTGTKKLKDYLSDRKVEAINRDKLLLLAHGNRIYWVQGVGISQEARVDEATTQIVEIRLLPKDR